MAVYELALGSSHNLNFMSGVGFLRGQYHMPQQIVPMTMGPIAVCLLIFLYYIATSLSIDEMSMQRYGKRKDSMVPENVPASPRVDLVECFGEEEKPDDDRALVVGPDDDSALVVGLDDDRALVVDSRDIELEASFDRPTTLPEPSCLEVLSSPPEKQEAADAQEAAAEKEGGGGARSRSGSRTARRCRRRRRIL